MQNLAKRIERVERALEAQPAADWFEIIKENGLERGQEILTERGMLAELTELRELMAKARALNEQWERELQAKLKSADTLG